MHFTARMFSLQFLFAQSSPSLPCLSIQSVWIFPRFLGNETFFSSSDAAFQFPRSSDRALPTPGTSRESIPFPEPAMRRDKWAQTTPSTDLIGNSLPRHVITAYKHSKQADNSSAQTTLHTMILCIMHLRNKGHNAELKLFSQKT